MRIGVDIDGVLNDIAEWHYSCGFKFCTENDINREFDPYKYMMEDQFKLTDEENYKFWKEYIFDLMVSLGVDSNIELTEETSIDEIFSRKNDEILESKIQNKYNINRLLFKVSEAHYMWELINLVLNSDRGDKNEEA